MGPLFPENSSKMTRGSHQMAGLIVLYSIKMRVSLECGSLSRASFFGGFTVVRARRVERNTKSGREPLCFVFVDRRSAVMSRCLHWEI